jgi:L-lactate dehydrogenase
MADARFAAESLTAFAQALLERCGVRADIAKDVAEILVAGDLLGHRTHGLALLAGYLGELEKGTMLGAGEPAVVSARPAAQAWDGRRLPGPWLTLRALDAAMAMAATHGTGTVTIRRSHHIACLAAYLMRATERGLIAIIQSSDPFVAAVVPHGGLTPFITPNPLAAGLPTSGDPILIDVSMSITSMGYTKQRMDAGAKLPGPWLIDAQGNATDDPSVAWVAPKGALLPLGGLDAGHKGYGLGLLIEALTAGLSGFGRADPREGWGAAVFVQVLDPEAFGGRKEFLRQVDFVAAAARASQPRPGVDRVRLPGEGGLARYREQQANGVALYPAIMPDLAPWAAKLGVTAPKPLG